MNKEEFLQELYQKLMSGEISHDEVVQVLGYNPATVQQPSSAVQESPRSSGFSVTKMLYVIGAVIVVAGISFFIGQIWNDIGAFGRILVTLGLGLLLAGLGSMFMIQKPEEDLGSIFHFMGGMLVPGGALVTLNELGVNYYSIWPVTITFGIIFAFYLFLGIIHKRPILTFFSIASGTTFYYMLVEAIVPGPLYRHEDLYAYLTMAAGLSYLFLAQAFRRGGTNGRLVDFLYFFGSGAFLGAAFSRVFDSVPWQLLFFLLVFGYLFLSVYMKSRIILTVSTLFLLIHISYITSEYFADSMGWPISLVILGFIFIGLGYASVSINRKYISNSGVILE